MKVSEILPDDAIKYCRLEGDDADSVQLYIDSAKAYVYRYTGLTAEEADSYPELCIAVLALIGDFITKRTMSDETANKNKTVESILNMHCRNLIVGD